VKSDTWNDTILAGHREHLRDDSVKEAFDVVVRAAIDSAKLRCRTGVAWGNPRL
jgi:hypothetical protein